MMAELLSAFLGAVVGGLATFSASWWQTQRVLDHDRRQARQAAQEDGRNAREAVTRQAAAGLMDALATYTSVPDPAGPKTQAQQDRIVAHMLELRRLETAQAPLLGPDFTARWRGLVGLLQERHRMRVVPDDQQNLGLGEWHRATMERAVADVLAYAAYVHRSLVAVVDHAGLPPYAEPPVLTRADMAVWQPPDQPQHAGDA
jgi:hypothetical protein